MCSAREDVSDGPGGGLCSSPLNKCRVRSKALGRRMKYDGWGESPLNYLARLFIAEKVGDLGRNGVGGEASGQTSAWDCLWCLFIKAVFKEGNSVSATGWGGGGHTVKHDATHSTPTACSQVWGTSLPRARLSSLRRERPLQRRASRREKKGKPATTEHLPILHSVL